jgi:signal transduction histidine kinase
MADGRKIWRVFENLISNILKYSLKNTRVYIDITQRNDNIYISMKNISTYELNFDPKEITERFKRGDESRNTEGSGLGLAIAKSLVELQGGKFDIEIDGDLFKVTLIFKSI